MARYLLHHCHQPHKCGIVFASFKGNVSPLRRRAVLASCPSGGHEIWWTVEAETEADALRLLPCYAAQRTTVTRVSEVEIPWTALGLTARGTVWDLDRSARVERKGFTRRRSSKGHDVAKRA